ncbi:hypothetical protein JW998_08890 [candidate division KSB1 bacterium]|nr:hypothetical protein [candidate division KSB1 bacterium]
MLPILQKLQFKNQDKIYVLGAPAEFKDVLNDIAKLTIVKKSPTCKQEYEFALFFVRSCADIEACASTAAAKVPGDGILWFAYPKKSSKKYVTDITRDSGWQPLGDLGFENVRMVAIDDDWSAVRFRRVEYIRSLRRDKKRTMTRAGKSRAD